MKIDLYTKTVLTGILGCLLWLSIMHTAVATPVQAQLGPTSVVIAGYSMNGGTQGMERGLPVSVLGGGETALTPTTPPSVMPMPHAAVPAQPTPVRVPAYQPPTSQTVMRCQATTQKGAQCKRTAKAGSNFCWQHGR